MGEIRFEHVDKTFPDGTVAVDDLSLEVAEGEFVILVGPSGCGKSTALRMLAGLEDVTGGKLIVGARVVNDLNPKQRDIAMVFQNYALYPHMTVARNIGFALRMARVSKAEIRERVASAAAVLGLTELLDRKPGALSGGQRQRVAMGRAIVRNPAAFLMDEPLSNLDAKLRVHMRAEIAELQHRLNVTTLYVTHDQVEAMTMGDRVAVLSRGVLQQVAAPSVLYRHPDNMFVAGFIGSPAMNLLVGTLSRQGDDWEISIGTGSLQVPDVVRCRYPRVAAFEGREVAVGLRPEHFSRPGVDDRESRRVLTGLRVSLAETIGSEILVHAAAPARPALTDEMEPAEDDAFVLSALRGDSLESGTQVVARFDGADPPDAGDTIDVAFDTAQLHFFDLADGAALR